MTPWAQVERLVTARALERCEYCLMHQALQGATFHIEHIIPVSLGGDASLGNLALACPRCNLCKSNRTEGLDEETGVSTRLFHPRSDRWAEHFEWTGYYLQARTAVGRATIAVLDLNHARRQAIRQAEALFDLFPYVPE